MTREEKIDWLCRLRSWVGTPPRMTVGQMSKIVEVLTDTIEDLQTEPCEDAISRSEAINSLDGLYLDGESAQGYTTDANEDCLIGKYKAIEILDDLPSVNPVCKPCEDAISYHAVLSILDEVCRDFDKPREAVISIDNIADMLSELPSVQPEQKVGRWIPMHHSFEGVSESYFVYQYMCSECRALSYFRRDSEQHIVNGAICPNCYAKMEESEEA